MRIVTLIGGRASAHNVEISKLLDNATRIIIAVAFARRSGWKHIKNRLAQAIKKGTKIQIVVGTDFAQTDPFVLRRLAEMQRVYRLQCSVVQQSRKTFHPKLFYVERNERAQAIIGSANLTEGGFSLNAEASVLIEGSVSELGVEVDRLFALWRQQWKFIDASKIDIGEYEARFKEARQKSKRWSQVKLMKRAGPLPKTDLDFSEHKKKLRSIGPIVRRREVKRREGHRKCARKILQNIANAHSASRDSFLDHYERLVLRPDHFWHSGQLERNKGRIAKDRKRFSYLVRKLTKGLNEPNLDLLTFFEGALRLLREVNGAGPNVLTEILHTLDNRRFAVMNQNSVSGLRKAGIVVYPESPSKTSVSAEMLFSFHRDMALLRNTLQLKNFTEVDWLLNRMFFNTSEAD